MKYSALAVSASIATLLSIGWILIVTHIVNSATVSADAQHWVRQARQAYDLCYNGCNDCLNVGIIEKACRETERPHIASKNCNASSMWLWEDRYPHECLHSLGELMLDDNLKSKRFKLRFLYLLTVLPIALGWALYEPAIIAVRWVTAWSGHQRRRQARRRVLVDDAPRGASSAATPLLRTTTIATLAIALIQTAPVNAYACTDFHPVYNQPFVSQTDPSLFGNIHGWLSNCYRESYSCGNHCDKDRDGATSCSDSTCYREKVDKSPADYVRTAAKKVVACGFEMIDVVPGIASKRIANPRIEGELWVKLSINRFNGTSGVEDKVFCLADIVRWP